MKTINEITDRLIKCSIEFENQTGIVPAVSSALSEIDAMIGIGMSEKDIFGYKIKQKTRQKGHDFEYRGLKYQVKVDRESIKEGFGPGKNKHNSLISPRGEWDVLIWIEYDCDYKIISAYKWTKKDFKDKKIKDENKKTKKIRHFNSLKWMFDHNNGIRPQHIKQGNKITDVFPTHRRFQNVIKTL